MATLPGSVNSMSPSPICLPLLAMVTCAVLLATIASTIFVATAWPSTVEPAAGLVPVDELQALRAMTASAVVTAVMSLRFMRFPQWFFESVNDHSQRH
jgi:hypothetical protein